MGIYASKELGNMLVSPATRELIHMMNTDPAKIGVELEDIAIKALDKATGEHHSSASAVEIACKAFGDEARHCLYTDIIYAYKRQHDIPKKYDDLAGLFMDADYDQVFALLLEQKNVEPHMGEHRDAFLAFKKEQAEKQLPDTAFEGRSNYATWLGERILEDEPAYTSTIHNAVDRSIKRETNSLNSLVMECASYYRDVLRGIVRESLEHPEMPASPLFGRFKNVNTGEIAASRIAKEGIREIVMMTPVGMAPVGRKISFYINRWTNVADAVKKRYPVDQKFQFDGEKGCFFDSSGEETVSFTCIPVKPEEIHVTFRSGIKDVLYRNEGEDAEDVVTRRYLITSKALHNENEGDSGRMCDRDYSEILRWKIERREEPQPSPGMSM